MLVNLLDVELHFGGLFEGSIPLKKESGKQVFHPPGLGSLDCSSRSGQWCGSADR
jgi:hypothetical protein